LGENQLTGSIPPEIGNLINLNILVLYFNQLTNSIPPEIGNLINLVDLELGVNQLTGSIPPEIGNLINLTDLWLYNNQLTGSIPPEIGNLINLNHLRLNGNQLTGSIPSEIGNLTNLDELYLYENQLTGSISSEIGNLTNLYQLFLNDNQLSGEIPENICDLSLNWTNDNTFSITNNQFCPPYPECIEDYVGEQDTSNCSEGTVVITNILDVPDDQGGWVNVHFEGISFDDTDPNRTEAYYVQRNDGEYWNNVGSAPAINDSLYVVQVMTLVDSTSESNNGMTEFRVVASMDEGTWISESAWGYSVDNIAPAVPTNLLLTYYGEMVVLTWDPPVDEDFQYFSVFRNGELADYTVEPEYMENQFGADYNVTATDANGNESEPSETASGYSVDVVNLSGWNLVGLPLEVEDASYSNLFPESINGTLYSFGEGYILDSTLVHGEGYWLRFNDGGSTTIDGTPINELTISLNEDWNLVSGLSEDISIYSVSDPDSIIIPGTLYGFNEGYVESDILVPGNGYWLRAFQAGDIILSSGALSKVKPHNFSLKGKANSLNVNGMDLYFGVEMSARERLSYGLPPKPLSGAFDVRFSGDTRIAMDKAEIEVMNPYQTITISYDVVLDAGEHINWVLSSSRGEEYILEGTGEIIVPTEETFTLERKAIIPIAYTLHQNYPNPFNPVTSLRYDLPEQAQVTLTVYDLIGREVTQLVNTTQDAGYRSVQWNATDMHGKPVSAGVYLYQIRAGEFVQTRKMVLLK
jgi:hypothetical protein